YSRAPCTCAVDRVIPLTRGEGRNAETVHPHCLEFSDFSSCYHFALRSFRLALLHWPLMPKGLRMFGDFFDRATAAAASNNHYACKDEHRRDDRSRTHPFMQQQRRQHKRNQWLKVNVNRDGAGRYATQRPRIQV